MLQDGIYFNLNEDEYHKDLALGSTNLKMLLGNPEDYWYEKFKESRTETPALTYGRQIHKCILEGVEAFSETYAPYEGNLNTKAGKEAFELAKATGKTPIKLDEFNKILSVNTQIKQDPSIDKIFKKGIAEISVIWTDEKTGIRFKARFDYLRKNSIIDLKTLSNPNNKPMHIAVKDAIAGFNYIVSAAHYINARRQMNSLFNAGKIFGTGDKELLKSIVATEYFGFIFVFWKKSLAPIARCVQLLPENKAFALANKQILNSIEKYQDYYAEFGLSEDKEWRRDTTIEELDIYTLPTWFQYQNNEAYNAN